jgi:gamma-glutamyltranspeptidase/glutathione hydrolase
MSRPRSHFCAIGGQERRCQSLCMVIWSMVAALLASSSCIAQQQSCVLATVQPLATDAGLQAYREGGNAVDAAIAAALTLGVVDTHNSGIGGGCFILIRRPDGGILAIDGRETAPVAATADMFVRDATADPQLSTTGALAVGVPGALAAYETALQRAGRRQLGDLLRPAAELADRGFAIDRIYARNLQSKADVLARFAGSRATLLKPDGQPYREGETLRQPDLARTYRMIADRGTDWFYRGPFASSVARWMSENGGILTAADFAAYRPIRREPIVTRYRQYQVVGFPPPSSGGIHVAQILNILENFELASERQNDPSRATNLVVEAMKLAFADRAHWLGDADFAEVPLGLTDKAYARSLAGRIRADRSTAVPSHGNPLEIKEGFFGRHTTHIAAADTEGYWVAITATVNTHFGSKVIVPGTGVVLNNEMDDFSSQPGVPNAFGLIGAANNAIAAGKRPLSSMSPTIILDAEGSPVMTVGAAGGPKIITQVLLTIIRHLDFGDSLPEAVAAPRFHHQWRPDSVLVEESLDPSLVESLKRLGHEVVTTSHSGVTQAVGLDLSGVLLGVGDPRVPGKVGRASQEVAEPAQ